MERVICVLLVVVGIINFLPVAGVLSAETLARAYGIDAPEGDLLILMRHRALLFGIIGSLIIASAFYQHLQTAAMIAGFVSMVGFLLLALSAGGYGEKIQGVVVADVAATVLLVAAFVLRRVSQSGA